MRGILQIYKSFSVKLTVFMVFSFLVSGCHTGEDPVSVPHVTEKKEATNRNQAVGIKTDSIEKTRKKTPETPVKHSASGILLPEKQANKDRLYVSASDDKDPDASGRRDPFALPAALRKQQTVTRGNQVFSQGKTQTPLKRTAIQQPAVPPAPGYLKPRIAGIFDNGNEKLALIHWQQIQGTFRRGESVGNGYYVREITPTAVSLYPEKSASGMKPVTLTLQ